VAPKRLFVFLPAVWLCCWLTAAAEAKEVPPGYEADRWTTEQGMPDNQIRALRQTRDGYIWMTTEGGLVRFDGLRFRVFNTANTPVLRTDRYAPFALWEDREGGLWAATLRAGVVRYFRGEFSRYDTKSGLPNDVVSRIDEDERGVVWIYTMRGLAKWENGAMTTVPLTGPYAGAPAPERARMTVAMGISRIHFGEWDMDEKGWWRLAYGKWMRMPAIPGVADPRGLRLRNLTEDQQGRLWFTVQGRAGVCFAVDRQGALTTYDLAGVPPDSRIVYADRRGRRLLTSADGQLQVWERGTYSPVGGIATLAAGPVMEDREGQLWTATMGEGLLRVKEKALHLHTVPGALERSLGFVVLRDREGTIWYGTRSGLFRFRDGQFQRVLPAGLRGNERPAPVSALYEDRDGTIWVGTDAALCRVRNGVLERSDAANAVGRVGVNAILRDRAGTLWLATEGRLWRQRAGGKWEVTGYSGLAVRALLEDRNGLLWLATNDGLARYTGTDFKMYRQGQGMPAGQVVALMEDRAGMLWAGTAESGLVRVDFDGQRARFTVYTNRTGLFDNAVYEMVEDGAGNFWISSRPGIFRVRRRELEEMAAGKRTAITTTHFGPGELSSFTILPPRGTPRLVSGRDGMLWFATMNGLAMLDPSTLGEEPPPPEALVEDCLVDLRPVPCRNGLRLESGAKDLEVNYAGLRFVRPGQLQFRYRLEGFDRDWVTAGTRRTAYYPRLPSGTYQFQVMTGNSDGVWSDRTTAMTVTVLPPFYLTWWFLALGATGVAGLAYGVHHWRITRLREANARQARFARQLIALQELERKRIAAELHDSLGQSLLIIKNQAALGGMSASGESEAQFAAILDTAAESLEEVRQIAADLRPHHLDRLGLTQALEAMVEKAAGVTAISFVVDIDRVDGAFVKEDEITVFRVMQESVSNILKHSEATEARVRVRRLDGEVLVEVEDNGKGFAPQGALEKQGFGMTGIAERVRILGGEQTVESAPGQGTRIRIRLQAKGAGGGR
jgi:signal transduction histidine kinase/ligand-binding sensor domain-containing protein